MNRDNLSLLALCLMVIISSLNVYASTTADVPTIIWSDISNDRSGYNRHGLIITEINSPGFTRIYFRYATSQDNYPEPTPAQQKQHAQRTALIQFYLDHGHMTHVIDQLEMLTQNSIDPMAAVSAHYTLAMISLGHYGIINVPDQKQALQHILAMEYLSMDRDECNDLAIVGMPKLLLHQKNYSDAIQCFSMATKDATKQRNPYAYQQALEGIKAIQEALQPHPKRQKVSHYPIPETPEVESFVSTSQIHHDDEVQSQASSIVSVERRTGKRDFSQVDDD